jgi:divalent metal cation (Fe/Co/Zn/Cd) transporter
LWLGDVGIILESISRLKDKSIDTRDTQGLGQIIATVKKLLRLNRARVVQKVEVFVEIIDRALLYSIELRL